MVFRINRGIKVSEVRVVTEEGEQLGVMSTSDAVILAESKDMDLVEISPNTRPPICKVMDYGKFMYSLAKKGKLKKKLSVKVKVKEIKMKAQIGDRDFDVKINHAKGFLKKGHKVKFTSSFRGRELSFMDNAKLLFNRICDSLKDEIIVESPVKLSGRIMSMLVVPSKKKESRDAQCKE